MYQGALVWAKYQFFFKKLFFVFEKEEILPLYLCVKTTFPHSRHLKRDISSVKSLNRKSALQYFLFSKKSNEKKTNKTYFFY